MTREDLMNEWLDKIDFFKERLEKRRELIKDIAEVNLIGVDIDSERKVISDFLSGLRNNINNSFSVYDECIGIPTKAIADYILENISEEQLVIYLETVIDDILKQYEKFGGDNGVYNLNYNKSIVRQVGNCYLLSNEIQDIVYINEVSPTAKKYTYHGINGVLRINNKELISCEYLRG